MRHHAIAADVPCPHCGRPGLVFVAKSHIGDKYQCHACHHAIMHTSNGASRLFGQAESGTIVGVVTDQAGAVVPTAKVTLVNEGTNATRVIARGMLTIADVRSRLVPLRLTKVDIGELP